DADLPAGICGVVPVAATDPANNFGLASFSNLPFIEGAEGKECLSIQPSNPADVSQPIKISLSPLQGPMAMAAGVNTCGIFLQKVPPFVATPGASPSPSSPTGTAPQDMALWNGTSFATGLASGYIARQIAQGAWAPTPGSLVQVPDMQLCSGVQ